MHHANAAAQLVRCKQCTGMQEGQLLTRQTATTAAVWGAPAVRAKTYPASAYAQTPEALQFASTCAHMLNACDCHKSSASHLREYVVACNAAAGDAQPPEVGAARGSWLGWSACFRPSTVEQHE